MKVLATVPAGIESVACAEASELLSLKSESGEGWICFEVREINNALRFAYLAQSVAKVMIVTGEERMPPKDSVENVINRVVASADFSLLSPGLCFAGRAIKSGSEDIPSPEIAAMLGAAVQNATKASVNLKSPDALVTAFVAPDLIAVGFDVTGEDIAKRPYRIFQQGQPIKAPIAYALVRESGSKNSLLDPFCRAGTIPIEAALWASGTSQHRFFKERLFFYQSKIFKNIDVRSLLEEIDAETKEHEFPIIAMDESFRSISAARKNAKIAGIEKRITFSKLDVDWLDVKFGKNGIDSIATFPPLPSRLASASRLEKVYKEFMYQCDYILAKKGKIAMLVKSVEPWLNPIAEHGFKISSSRPVFQGKEQFLLIVIERD